MVLEEQRNFMIIGNRAEFSPKLIEEHENQTSQIDMFDTKPITPVSDKPVLVVGMGPAGLATAIEAARAGKSVTIFDNRTDYTRLQRVGLNPASAVYLQKLKEGTTNETVNKLHDKFIKDTNKVEIKDLQRFLEEAIKHTPELNSLITIKKGNSSLSSISGENQTATFSSNGKSEQMKFSHVVDATGGRGLSGLDSTGAEKRMLLPIQPRQEEQGSVTLNTLETPIDGKNLRTLKQGDLAVLKTLGWDKPYLPDVFVFSNSKGTKHYIAGEIPQSILYVTDENIQRIQMQKWGEAILRLRYSISESVAVTQYGSNKTGLRVEAKKKMATTVFPAKLSYSREAAEPLSGGGVLARVGDASLSANFYLAHGANDAIADAVVFGKSLLDKSGFDVMKFNEYQFSRRALVEKRMLLRKDTAKKTYEATQENMKTEKDNLMKSIQENESNFRINLLLPLVAHFKVFATDLGAEDMKKELEELDPTNIDTTLMHLLIMSGELESKIDENECHTLAADVLEVSAQRRTQLREIRLSIIELRDKIQSAAQKNAIERSDYEKQQQLLEVDIAKYDALLASH